jgi:phosphatidylserine/phosphatidylglycerophosphate/cardiolipin synthase-like enzyme
VLTLVTLEVLEASALPPRRDGRAPDPYFSLTVSGCVTKSSRVCVSSLSPQFEGFGALSVPTPFRRSVVEVRIRDFSLDGDDVADAVLGCYTTSVAELARTGGVDGWVELGSGTPVRARLRLTVSRVPPPVTLHKGGPLGKIPGGRGRRALPDGLGLLGRMFRVRSRYAELFDGHLALMHSQRSPASACLLFDACSAVALEPAPTGPAGARSMNFSVRACGGGAMLRAASSAEAEAWVDAVGLCLQIWRRAYRASVPGGVVPVFAPWRAGARAHGLCNGDAALTAVAEALEGATRVVLIAAGPEVTPGLLLRTPRPGDGSGGDTLGSLLRRKASEGVVVRVLVEERRDRAGEEEEPVNALMALHPNIEAVCHPSASWRQGQRAVVVDGTVAVVGSFDLALGRRDIPLHPVADVEKWPLFPGAECVLAAGSRARQPRHTVAVRLCGVAALDVERCIVDRWNAHRKELRVRGRFPALRPTDVGPLVLESVGSAGSVETLVLHRPAGAEEASVPDPALEAALAAIATAEHLVYLESSAPLGPSGPLLEALYARVQWAIRANVNLRVIAVLPLLPEGLPSRPSPSWLAQARAHRDSLFGLRDRFRRDYGPRARFDDYFSFHGLRSFGLLADGSYATEQVVVDANLLVVDDKTALVCDGPLEGAARAAAGVGLAFTDKDLSKREFDGVPGCPTGAFPRSLRKEAMAAHLFCPDEDEESMAALLGDPVKATFYWGLWKKRSRTNTSAFQRAFPSIPSDGIQSLSQLQDGWTGASAVCTIKAAKGLAEVKGFLVDQPFEFLSEQWVRKG